MKSCIGIFGKYFGHKYRRYLIKEPSRLIGIDFKSTDPELIKIYLDSLVNHYEIRCKRCGVKIDD